MYRFLMLLYFFYICRQTHLETSMLDYGGVWRLIWILCWAHFWTGRGLVLVLCALCYKVSIWLAKIGRSSILKSWISQSETTKKLIDLIPNTPLIQLWCARSKLNMDEICSLNIHLWYVDIPQKVLLKSLHAQRRSFL